MGSLYSPETWPLFGHVDTELAEMLQRGNKPQFDKTYQIADIPATRAAWNPLYKDFAAEALRAAQPDVLLEEIFVTSRDGSPVRCLVYKPAYTRPDGCPLLVFFHGGGFCFGAAEMDAINCIKAVQRYHAVAISVDYRLAPEHVFPIAVNDSWDILQWVTRNLSQLGANPSLGFIIGGTSAGGNISAALSHLARDTGLTPPLTGIWLNIPTVLAPDAVPSAYKHLYLSRSQHKEALILPKAAMDMYEEAYRPAATELWNPLNWSTGHADLPPHYFQICGMDVLRDEALIYERIHREESGIKTKVDIYPGLPHVFWANFPTHSKSKNYSVDTNEGLGWLLKLSE